MTSHSTRLCCLLTSALLALACAPGAIVDPADQPPVDERRGDENPIPPDLLPYLDAGAAGGGTGQGGGDPASGGGRESGAGGGNQGSAGGDARGGGGTAGGDPSGTAGGAPLGTGGGAAPPVYVPPPLVPNSFHIITIDDAPAWDSILALTSDGPGPMITSQNKHPDLPFWRWTRNVSYTWFTSGAQMADVIHQILSDPNGSPARVMIDELRSDSITIIADAANRLRTVYPQHAGRWGAYVVNGENVGYAGLNPAIDALLDAQAPIAVEMYAHQSRYCQAGTTDAARDTWLAGFFRGEQGQFSQARFAWLAARRNARGSVSHLSILFGVTDDYMSGTNPAKFLDRMFFVWATRSGFRSTMLMANGGVGAWKWDLPYMSNTTRDLAFAQSLQHYSVTGATNSRLGSVDCP